MNAIMESHAALLTKCFDFSPPAGWGAIIVMLLDDIKAILRAAEIPDGVFHIRQVKEKFGGLRVYVDGYPVEPSPMGMWLDAPEETNLNRSGPLPRSWHLENVGTLEFDVDVDDASIKRVLAKIGTTAYLPDQVARKIHQRIDDAKDEADRTCQICGARGHAYIDGGWHFTVCTTHRDMKARQEWWDAHGRT